MGNIIQIILWVIDWGRKKLGLLEPFNKLVEWALIVGIVIFTINLIMTLVGQPIFDLPTIGL